MAAVSEGTIHLQLGSELSNTITLLEEAITRQDQAAEESERRHRALRIRLARELEVARRKYIAFGLNSCPHPSFQPNHRTAAGHLGSRCKLCGRIFEGNKVTGLRDITDLPRTFI